MKKLEVDQYGKVKKWFAILSYVVDGLSSEVCYFQILKAV